MKTKSLIYLFNTYDTVTQTMENLAGASDLDNKFIPIVLGKLYRGKNRVKTGYLHFQLPTVLAKSKILSHLYYAIRALFFAVTRKMDGAIIFTQPPLFYILLSTVFRIRGIKYIVHILDLHPEMFFGLDMMNSNSSLAKILLRWSRQALDSADAIVVIGECMKNRILDKGISPSKIHLIHVMAWDKKPWKEKIHSFLKNPGEQKLRISYVGNLGRIHTITEIMKLLEDIQVNNLSHLCHFDFVTQGKKRMELEKYISNRGITNVRFHDYLEETAFTRLLYESHFHLITLRQEIKGISVPSKFFASLYSGSQVLYVGPEDSEVYELTRKHQVGLACTCGTELFPILKPYILEEIERPKKYDPRISGDYISNYHSDVFCKKYEDIISLII